MKPVCRGWPEAIMSASAPLSPHLVCSSADVPLCVLVENWSVNLERFPLEESPLGLLLWVGVAAAEMEC